MKHCLILISAVLWISNSYSMEDIKLSNDNTKGNIISNNTSIKSTNNNDVPVKDIDIGPDFIKYCDEIHDSNKKEDNKLYKRAMKQLDNMASINTNTNARAITFCKMLLSKLQTHYRNINYYFSLIGKPCYLIDLPGDPVNDECVDLDTVSKKLMGKAYIISLKQLKEVIALFNSFEFSSTFKKLDPKKIDEIAQTKPKKLKWVNFKIVVEFLRSSFYNLFLQTELAIIDTMIDNESPESISKNIRIILNQYQSILQQIILIIIESLDKTKGDFCNENNKIVAHWQRSLRACLRTVAALDIISYSNSKMESRFNTFHKKLINNLKQVIDSKYKNTKVNIKSKVLINGTQPIRYELQEIDKLNTHVKDVFHINKKIPSASDLIVENSSKMPVKNYIENTIDKIEAIKTFVDDIIKQTINQPNIIDEYNYDPSYKLHRIMEYYFCNIHHLLSKLNIKELRQAIDYIHAFYSVYLLQSKMITHDTIHNNTGKQWEKQLCFLRWAVKFDSSKHSSSILESNDYLSQYQLNYPQGKFPQDTFEKVLDDPNGDLSLGYNLQDLKWFNPKTEQSLEEVPIQ